MVKLDYDISQTQENFSETTSCDDGCHQKEAFVAINRDADSERKHGFVSLAECLSIERALEASSIARNPVPAATCAAIDSTIPGRKSIDQFLFSESKVVKSDSYIDKAMAETERPKMIVCFEKEAYELVKDICIDNGVPSFDKLSLSSSRDKLDELKLSTAHQHDEEWARSNDAVPGFDNLNTFLLNEQSVSGALNGVSGQELKETESHKETGMVTGTTFLSATSGSGRCADEVCPSNLNSITDGMPTSTDGKPTTVYCFQDVHHQDSSKWHSSKEANTQESFACSDEEPPISDSSREADKPKDFPTSETNSEHMKQHDNAAPDTVNETEGTLDPPQHGNSRDLSRETSEGLTAEARSSLVHYGFADASIFGPHSMQNSMSFNGQIAYNGSTSLRSDSSTTSTRSFAFPILQSEWNSSPVKMAKADRKYYRRHRWRNGFLCCRF